MNRREFLKTGAAAAVTTTASLEARAAIKRKRPNVLFVFSDQHRASALPGEPYNQALAPNIAAFRERNCSMDQCVSNYPLCSPFRAILLSGLYPQQNGVLGNVDVLEPSVGPLGETFRSAGYHTGYIGKWHIHGQESVGREDLEFIPKGPYRMGFEDWRVWANTNDHYHTWTFDQETGEKIKHEGWQPVRMTDEAIEFLKAQPKNKPWFLMLSWNPPHPPFDPPETETAPYQLDGIKFRPNTRTQANAIGEHRAVRSESSLRKSAQGYLGGITGVDKEFARLLKALEETGDAKDTIVVYTSDHGEMLGSQGRMGKRVPFEESCRIPFIVRYPGVTEARHKCSVPFSAVDIYPTMCGLAGVPVPKHCAGLDLSDAMRGRNVREPEHVFLLSENERGDAPDGGRSNGMREEQSSKFTGGCPPYRGIRTKTHTYIVADTGRWLLYDNIADPYQMKNMIGEMSMQPLMEKLDAAIEAWLHSVNDKFPYTEAKRKIANFSS